MANPTDTLPVETNSQQFTNTVTVSNATATELGVVYTRGARPLVRCEVVNAVAGAGTLTLLAYYKAHSDSGWVALPAGNTDMPATLAEGATPANFVINAEGMDSIRVTGQLATAAKAVVFRGTCGDKTPSASVTVNADIGDVNILNAAGTKIDPAEAQAANTAYVAADKVTPVGAVKYASRTAPETFADGDWVPVNATANGDLRTRDDDLNTSASDIKAAVQTLTLSGQTVGKKVLSVVTAAGYQTIGQVAAKVVTLHKLAIVADAAGTWQIAYDDDGAGTNEVVLVGPVPIGTYGGIAIDFGEILGMCPASAAGKYLTIKTATSKIGGVAVYSYPTA